MPIQYPSVGTFLPGPPRPLLPALLRGWHRRCPQCGKGSIFRGYSKVCPLCSDCGLELFHERTDDAPPYFTILILGHIIIPLLLLDEAILAPPQWVQIAIFVPLTTVLTLWLLPRVKGALVAFQWSRYMHGFGGDED